MATAMDQEAATGAPEAVRGPSRVALLLLEQFAMIAFSSTLEPLREANWLAGWKAYEWSVLSHDGRPVRASNGLTINVDGAIADVTYCPTVIVCSSFDPHLGATPEVLTWLRKLDRLGARIGGVETGAYVLARAGLLDGYRATIHWENADSITSRFPNVILTSGLFEIDRRRFTASGAAAAMDMMLHFVGLDLGRKIATGVAEEFMYNRIRSGADPQRLAASDRVGARRPRLRRLLDRAETILDARLDLAAVAAAEGISERELRRIFADHVGTSPQAYHRRLRLEKARSLLRQTELPASNIAASCGFTSGSDFSRSFRRAFGHSPGEERARVHLNG